MKYSIEKKLLLLLLAASFCVYTALGLLGPANFWDHYTGSRYIDVAVDLLHGRGYTGLSCCMPLYPLTLAGLLAGFGRASLPVLLFHVLTGTGMVFFTYKLGRTLFSDAVGLVAGLLILVQPYLLKLTIQIIDTGLSVALTTLAGWLVLRAWKKPDSGWKDFLLPGLAFGLATLTRSFAGVYLLFIAAGLLTWLLIQRQYRRGLQIAAALLITWAIVLSPWWLHNWLAYQRFIPLTENAGYSFLKGHTPNYTGVQPNYDTDLFPYYTEPSIPPDEPNRILFNTAALQTGLQYVRAHPLEAAVTDLKKVVWLYWPFKVPRTFTNSHPVWDAALGRVVDPGARPALADRIYTLYWTPVLVLFLTGLLLSRKQFVQLIPAYMLLLGNLFVVVMSFADTRYRLEADPFILCWAAFSAILLFQWEWRKLNHVTPQPA